MNWTGGYVADIGYTAGFYRETSPAYISFAALMIGRSPGRAFKPARVLELGFGQGFGIALLAAANPDVAFEGYDFNPEHVAHARRLVQNAGIGNVSVVEASFEEVAAKGGDNDVDIVVLHGIFSWVAPATQEAILSIIRQRLLPDGLVYISYNCMPGWAALAPIRQLMLQIKRRNPGSSDHQLALALDLLQKMKQSNALFFSANPSAGQQFDAMLGMDRVYLAHEYLDEHWDLFEFAELAERLGAAKLAYVASATLLENLDNYAVPKDMHPLIQQSADPIFRETLRDFASNKRFRRDLFARGSATLTAAEHRQALSKLSFALVVPPGRATFTFAAPVVGLTGHEEIYRPVVDRLAEGKASFDELLALEPFKPDKLGMLLDCVTLLVQSEQIVVVVGDSSSEAAVSQKFNRIVVDHARAGRRFSHLASPVARTGIPVPELGLLTLAGLFDGKSEVDALALHALQTIKGMGRLPYKDGQPIADEAEAIAFLTENIKPIVEEWVPLWRKLGIF